MIGFKKEDNMSTTAQELKYNEEVYNKMTEAEIEDEQFVTFETEHMLDVAASITQINRYMKEKDQAVFDDNDTEFHVSKVIYDRKLDRVTLEFTD
jgi:predicted proteasome-type protease